MFVKHDRTAESLPGLAMSVGQSNWLTILLTALLAGTCIAEEQYSANLYNIRSVHRASKASIALEGVALEWMGQRLQG